MLAQNFKMTNNQESKYNYWCLN